MRGQQSVLAIESATYRYPGRPRLQFPDCALAAGDVVGLIGPSGSGKTTLLMLIAGLLTPQSGRIAVDGVEIGRLSGTQRDRRRGQTIGIVLQSFRLLPYLSVLENLTAAQFLSGAPVDVTAARQTLTELDIADLANERPGRLSRGQMQRAAIARAVVNRPRLLLADEPTSSLDDEAAAAAFMLLEKESRNRGATLVIATHDSRVKSQVPTILKLNRPAS